MHRSCGVLNAVALIFFPLGHLLVSTTAQVGLDIATNSRCPANCTTNGVCNEELGECSCPRGWVGPACDVLIEGLPEACKDWGFQSVEACTAPSSTQQPACVNGCNQRGRCVAGFCHCHPGYFGAGCELSLHAEGRPELLAGLNYTLRPQGPRIYVYELPGAFNVYKNVYRVDRPLFLLFWQRLLSAGVRTADPEEADYFFLPVRLRMNSDGWMLQEAIKYIRTHWPYWDRLQGRRHLVIHTGDMGRIELNPTAVRDSQNMTFITHWGLTQYQTTARWPASHRPGQDLVVPILVQPSLVDAYKLHATPLHPLLAQPRDANLKLFFAGRVCGDRQQPLQGVYPNCDLPPRTANEGYSAKTRQRVYYHHGNRTGYTIVTGTNKYSQSMASAQYCLAPTGSGHGKRNVLVSVMGCIPVTVTDHVMQPFEPELDWSQFSVHVPEEDIPRMHEILDAITPDQYEAKQRALRCAAQHMFWSTLFGGVMGEDGRFDAFETTMAILAARLRRPGVPPEQLAVIDPQLGAFMRCEGAPATEGSNTRQLCTHTVGDTGAPSCKKALLRPNGPLLIPGGALCSQAANLAQCPRW